MQFQFISTSREEGPGGGTQGRGPEEPLLPESAGPYPPVSSVTPVLRAMLSLLTCIQCFSSLEYMQLLCQSRKCMFHVYGTT